jgi:hypothetical protein
MGDFALLKKLLLRYDGAADSKTVRFTSDSGAEWQAELCLHSGTDPQSPRLMVIFRSRSRPNEPQRYTLAPPGTSKVPKEAAAELSDDDFRSLLARSVAM